MGESASFPFQFPTSLRDWEPSSPWPYCAVSNPSESFYHFRPGIEMLAIFRPFIQFVIYFLFFFWNCISCIINFRKNPHLMGKDIKKKMNRGKEEGIRERERERLRRRERDFQSEHLDPLFLVYCQCCESPMIQSHCQG